MNKIVLIVGATGNIGRTLARYLDNQSISTVLTGSSSEKLRELADSLHCVVSAKSFDLRDAQQIEEFFASLREKKIKLDGMVYCAGICSHGLIKTMTCEEMKTMFDINAGAFYLCAKYCGMPGYSNRCCSIVALSSIASRSQEAGLGLYSMTKAAMNSAVQVMSKEFIKRRIRVNAVLPAEVMSKMADSENDWSEEEINAVKQYQPYGPVPIEQVVKCIYFLLSEDSQYITGECIAITGGYEKKA